MTDSKNQAPSPLPRTIPAGTRANTGDRSVIAEHECRLEHDHLGKPWYRYGWPGALHGLTPDRIDWSSVPKESKPVFAPGMRVRVVNADAIDRANGFENGQETVLVRRENGGVGWITELHRFAFLWEKNLEPIEPEGAKPVEESDEQWLKRVVFELTGITTGFSVNLYPDRSAIVQRDVLMGCVLFAETVMTRNIAQVRNRLAQASWPLKDSPAGVGSVDSAKGNQAATVREESIGVFGSAQPTQAETYCAECGDKAEMGVKGLDGIRFCTVHALRRCEAIMTKARRLPCGPDCRCVYCVGRRRFTDLDCALFTNDSAKHAPAQAAARARLAAMDRNERPAPRSSSREKEAREVAAALVTWPGADEGEP